MSACHGACWLQHSTASPATTQNRFTSLPFISHCMETMAELIKDACTTRILAISSNPDTPPTEAKMRPAAQDRVVWRSCVLPPAVSNPHDLNAVVPPKRDPAIFTARKAIVGQSNDTPPRPVAQGMKRNLASSFY